MDGAAGRTSLEGRCAAGLRSSSLPVEAYAGCDGDCPYSFVGPWLEGGVHRDIANEDSPAGRRTDSALVLGADAATFGFRSFLAAERMQTSMACSRRPCLLVLAAG